MKNIYRLLVAAVLSLAPSMADAACWQWATTAASNATADPSINWAEGMAPSAVNDSARAMMARQAECRDDLSGKLVSTGTSTAYAVTTNQGLNATPENGQSLALQFNVINGAAPTLTADGGTAFPLQTAAGVAVAAGVLNANAPYRVTFRSASSAWILQDFYNATNAPGSVTTSILADNAVTYPKIRKPTTTSLLLGTPSLAAKSLTGAGNNGSGLIRITMADTTGLSTSQIKVVSGVVGTTEANGSWTITVISSTQVDLQGSTFTNAYVSGGTLGGSVEELTIGSGLQITNNVVSSTTAASFPPPGSFKNLSIKVASNTTVTAAADFVTTTNGTIYQTTAVSCTVNMASTGINALDVGSIASATWYAIWINAKTDGTTGCTASLQGTATATFLSNLPATYGYYARVGWVRTAAGSAQLLGTWQFGRRAQYVTGLAQTSIVPSIDNGTVGTFSGTSPTLAAVSVANFVPTTASVIHLIATNRYHGSSAQDVLVAPNTSWGGTNNGPTGSNNQGWPAYLTSSLGATYAFNMVLEATTIAWASSGAGGGISCLGWEDGI